MDVNDMLLRAQTLLTTIAERGIIDSAQLSASVNKWLKDFEVQPDEEVTSGDS